MDSNISYNNMNSVTSNNSGISNLSSKDQMKRDLVDPEVNDNFWSQDFSILFHPDRLHEFVPSKDMSTTERLNAISRFSIYTGIISSLFIKKAYPIYLAIFVLGFTLFVFENSKDSDTFKSYPLPNNAKNPFSRRLYYTEEDSFTPPTLDNPFANPLHHEIFDNPTRGPARNIEDTLDEKGVQKEITEYFNHNLYKDVSDIWSKNNSQREFYTVPNTTIPNKQNELAQWLYGSLGSCKTSSYDCHPYEDLRRKRFIYPFPSDVGIEKKDKFNIPTSGLPT